MALNTTWGGIYLRNKAGSNTVSNARGSIIVKYRAS